MKSKALDRLIDYAQRRYGTAWNGHGVDDLVRKAYALGRKESGKQVAIASGATSIGGQVMNAEIDALRRVRSEAINWRNIATQEKRDMERKLAAATDALAAFRVIAKIRGEK